MVMMKRTNGEADLRGGGTSSARMTAPLVAVAAVLRPWLEKRGIGIEAHLGAVGEVEAQSTDRCPPRWANETCEALRCRDPEAAKSMAELIDTTRKQRNSIGSRVDLAIVGLPMGLGEPWFDGLEPALARHDGHPSRTWCRIRPRIRRPDDARQRPQQSVGWLGGGPGFARRAARRSTGRSVNGCTGEGTGGVQTTVQHSAGAAHAEPRHGPTRAVARQRTPRPGSRPESRCSGGSHGPLGRR